tara:strand:+ start:313 stop:984 length:672 start_codon:yes stop_codon:yes gene_type:complete
MAGIGKYKKGAKFTLKSGNKPAFKMMGSSSPANMNNFGIGKGASPYKNEETTDDIVVNNENTQNNNEETTDKTNEKGGEAQRADKPWVKALKTATTLLSGGIQGVYGGKREYPKINYGMKTEESTKSPEERVNDAIDTDNENVKIENKNVINTNDDSKSTSYTIQSGDTLSKIASANNTTVEELMKLNPHIKDKNKIISGQDLKISSGSEDNENVNENTNINE